MIKWVGSKIEYFKTKFQGNVEIESSLELIDEDWRLTLGGLTISDLQISSRVFADNDTSLMTSGAVENRIRALTTNIYDDAIKVLPSDFMANDDAGAAKTIQFVDENASGLKPGADDTELLAFVAIPEGMKATEVDVYADDNLAFSVYELNIHQAVGDMSAASKGTGTCNTTLNITDVEATDRNYLLIQVITVDKADRIWGAKVTIAVSGGVDGG